MIKSCKLISFAYSEVSRNGASDNFLFFFARAAFRLLSEHPRSEIPTASGQHHNGKKDRPHLPETAFAFAANQPAISLPLSRLLLRYAFGLCSACVRLPFGLCSAFLRLVFGLPSAGKEARATLLRHYHDATPAEGGASLSQFFPFLRVINRNDILDGNERMTCNNVWYLCFTHFADSLPFPVSHVTVHTTSLQRTKRPF